MALLFLSTLLKDSGLLNDEYMFMHAGQDICEQKLVNRHCKKVACCHLSSPSAVLGGH